jgi:hypothetical protein
VRPARWLLLAFALEACGDPPPGEPRFSIDDCRAVRMVDEDGRPVEGAEDFALIEGESEIVLSAYDRLGILPGGLYRAAAGALPVAEGELTLETWVGGIRPHGLAAKGDGIAVILRADAGGDLIEEITGPRGNPERRIVFESPRLCAANDLDGEFVTLEGKSCGGPLAGALDGQSGAVMQWPEGRLVEEGLHLANGIAVFDGRVFVAEMRGRRIRELGGGSFALPGAPDNLHATDSGIVASLQPGLLRFGLYRFGLRGTAPSRIVLLDLASGETEILFDDPAGALVPAITSATLTGGMLVGTSVRGSRMLICEEGRS